ncbi:hypothetical protein GYMLUDRAFT_637777 [Collybiopsis luxurians FD-317 M1]|nr:hypothetical protein GYMLUDRAFT_637777 [Collybiopsis luxurians FD-317 M1]
MKARPACIQWPRCVQSLRHEGATMSQNEGATPKWLAWRTAPIRRHKGNNGNGPHNAT